MQRRRWFKAYVLALAGSLMVGCSTQASYMRGWTPVAGKAYRWTDGAFKESKLSDDETAVYQERGEPDVIRYFRALHTRQRVYEWLYEEQDEVVWFVDGKRVDYIAVDENISGLTKETREVVRHKGTTGGILGTVVGGFAAGLLLLGKSLGLKD